MIFAKKIITMFSAISLILLMISFPAMAAKISSSITGPSVLRAGDTFAVSVKADGEMLRGVSGEIRYNTDYLVYKSNAILLDGWDLDFDAGTSGVILLIATEGAEEAPLNGNTKVFSLTFQVKSGVKTGTAVEITTADFQASDGTSDFTSPDFTYSVELSAPLSGNNLLSSLKVANADIAPAFDKNTAFYTASVPFGVASLAITAATGDPKAKTSVAGNTLKVAGTTDVTVTVTAENGSKKVYTIRVTRAQDPDYKASAIAGLKSIVPSAGILSPPFAAGVVQYYVYLPNEITKFSASGVPGDPKGSVEAGAEIVLEVGVNDYGIAGIAEDGTRMEYRISVQRMPLPGESVPTPTAAPEEERIALSGILNGEDGKPLKSTFIQIDSAQIRTRTNESGFYQLSRVPFGEHMIYIIDGEGHILGSMTLALAKGGETRLKDGVVTVMGNTVIDFELKDGLKVAGVEAAAADIPGGGQTGGRTVPLIGALLLAAVAMLVGGVVSYFVLMARQIA